MATRQQIINYGMRNKKRIGDINNALKKGGHSGLTIKEMSLVSPKNILQEAGGDIQEFVGGAKTLTGGAFRLATDPKFRDRLYKKLGGTPESVATSVGKGIVRGLTSTYNTTPREVLNTITGAQGPKINIENVAQGIKENPLFFASDVLSAGGSSALAKTLPKVSKAVQVSENAPKILKQLLPTQEMRDASRLIKQKNISNIARTAPAQNQINNIVKLSPNADMEQVSRNIHLGPRIGDKATLDATKRAVDVSKFITRQAERSGLLSRQATIDNTIAQYVVAKNPMKYTHGEVMEFINLKNNGGKIPEELMKDIEKGAKLQKKGRIAFVSQALRPSKGSTQAVIDEAVSKGGYFDTPRIVGQTSPERLAEVLPESLEYAMGQVNRAKSSKDVLRGLVEQVGQKVSLLEKDKPEFANKIFISPSAIEKAIGKSFKGSGRSLYETIQQESRRIPKGANDLYAVDPMYIEALQNSVKYMTPDLLTRVNSKFKKSQLTTLKWIAENRIGNTYSNLLEGVTPKHYALADKFKKYIPDELRYETSYSGYTGEGLLGSSQGLEGIKLGVQQTLKGIKQKDPLKIYEGTTDIISSPIVKTEASLELKDRFANYIKQAEDFSKETNTPLAKVLIRAKKEPNLFWKLYTPVEKSMGDYTGRNYFLPPEVYKYGSLGVPFYKFPLQTTRVTARQLTRNPLGFYSSTILPSRVGRNIEEDIREDLKLGEGYKGGFPTGRKRKGTDPLRVYGSTSLPPYAVAQMVSGGLEGVAQSLSPILSLPYQALHGVSFTGQPITTPQSYNYGGKSYELVNGKPTGKEYEISNLDKSSYALDQLTNLLYSPYVVANRMVKPVYQAIMQNITGEPAKQSYESNPFITNPYSFPKTPIELVGPQFGLKTESVYPEYKLRGRSLAKIRRSMRKKQKRGQ